jgi:hypothetical protein
MSLLGTHGTMPVLEFDDNGLLERIATSRLRISPLTRIRLWQRYR